MNNNKKPFGLVIACSIAAKAIKDNIAPTSVILGNLLSLQKTTHFPKNLEPHNFTLPNVRLSDDDKKVINAILHDLRGPHQSVETLLEDHVKVNWVKKIPSKPIAKSITKKNVGKNTLTKKTINKPKTKVTPESIQKTVVTIKKSKLS